MKGQLVEGITITAEVKAPYDKIFSSQAAAFLAKLHREFNLDRIDLLKYRQERQQQYDEGISPKFLQTTAEIRRDPNWEVEPVPKELQKRWVEITGPTDRKMIINALNSGADVFMADFEDANSPTWNNMVEGQYNLIQAIERTLSFTNPEGKEYRLKDKTAVLMVRPRGWHLLEKHFLVDGEPISGSIFDFGLYFFHNAKRLIEKGSGPYFYLPKMESYQEAKLWNDIFSYAQEALEIPRGTIKATVLIETIPAAFEMEEILFELREHSAGLNAGRWDYIFSIIKKYRSQLNFVLPDRSQITMSVPFMRAYAELLIKTCHKRGAHAMGGMAAFIPSRKDPEVNKIALEKVREDKLREVSNGFDGTWVAHPDLVVVARDIFATALGNLDNQIMRKRQEVEIEPEEMTNFQIRGGKVTENGLRQNISIALQYLDAWLDGTGAVAIFNLMEDAATAEISRAQIWQWVHHPNVFLEDGHEVNLDLYARLRDEELKKLPALKKGEQAKTLLDMLVIGKTFPEFLTLLAYDKLE